VGSERDDTGRPITIYLDNAATSRPFPEAVEAVGRALEHGYGNPSSRHGLGLAASLLVEAARATLARAIGAEAREIVFTGGGSEANNLALKGAAWAYARAGRHLVVSAVEHPSVLEAARWLADEADLAVTFVPVGRDGRVDPLAVAAAADERTVLVSLMHVNNEVGSVQPVGEVGRRLRALRATSGRRKGLPLFHVDAVQSLGRLPIDVRSWGADLLTVSAHKVHGPKGVGALFVRHGVRLTPLVHGGGHEAGRRSGTENVPGIAGFGAALARLGGLDLAANARRLSELRRRFIAAVSGGEVVVNGPEDETAVAGHIISLSFPGIPAEVLQHHLEERGVFVSTGSACSSHYQERASHVLVAMECPPAVVASAIRVSLSPLAAADEILAAGRVIGETAGRLAGGGPSRLGGGPSRLGGGPSRLGGGPSGTLGAGRGRLS
jgi:cysteine desulfurase